MDRKERIIQIETSLVKKIIRMFRPAEHGLGPYSASELIQGPNDRAIIGYDTFFCKEWLVEDYNFTEEEAELFIELVRTLAPEEEEK